MILKELDLDIPSLDKDSRHDFRNEVRCIAAHYYSFLPKKYKTDNFWKILVECVDTEQDNKLYLGVKVVKIKFDYEHYLTLDNHNRKVVILDTLHKGVMKVSDEQEWNPTLFDTCFSKVVNDSYYYTWYFKKPKKNRTKNTQLPLFVSTI